MKLIMGWFCHSMRSPIIILSVSSYWKTSSLETERGFAPLSTLYQPFPFVLYLGNIYAAFPYHWEKGKPLQSPRHRSYLTVIFSIATKVFHGFIFLYNVLILMISSLCSFHIYFPTWTKLLVLLHLSLFVIGK